LVPSTDSGLFNLFVNSTTVDDQGDSGTTGKVPANEGANTIGEGAGTGTSLSGYNFTVSCVLRGTTTSVATSGTGPSWTLNASNGEDIVCTITNTVKAGTLTLVKTVVNDNGGTKVASDFQAYIDGNPVAWNTPITFDTGSYTASEDEIAGYTASDWGSDCAADGSVTLGPGENKTCTITNDDQPGTLIVRKIVNNDNGGTKGYTDFSFSVDGGNPITFESDGQNEMTVNAGYYNVTEPAVTGYSISYDNCSNIYVPNGGSATCTITNCDVQPELTVIKHVVNAYGGTAVAGDFTINVTATNPSQSSFSGAESPGTTITLDAGEYSVDEVEISGYEKSLSPDCSGTISIGDKKTCTITNSAIQPLLTVIKHVINDNGGENVASDFSISVTGNGPNPSSFYGAEDPGTTVGIGAGSYNVLETPLPGYIPTYSDDCVGSINLGETKTCTITNDDSAPALHLRKVVIDNNGGTAVDTDWTLSATGPTTISGSTPVDSGSDFEQGTYTLSESGGPDGYTASAWDCEGGTQRENYITLGLGESATCTITNDDIAPTLKLVKNVSGGSSVSGDWTLTATGTDGFSDSGDSITFHNVLANTDYTLSESGPSGYTAGSWSCDGGNLNGNTLSLDLAENVTCSITNTRDTGSVRVHKHLDTDGNGQYDAGDSEANTLGFDWGLDQETPARDMGTTENGVLTLIEHTISESSVNGYHYVGWFEGEGSCLSPNEGTPTFTLASAGQTAIITLCNARDTGSITIVKNTVGGNGEFNFTSGTLPSSDFSITTTGNTGDQLFDKLVTGTYDVQEVVPEGWTLTSVSCSDGSDISSIDLSYGENITCTFTNGKKPTLVLHKDIVNDNGGTATLADFQGKIDGNNVPWDQAQTLTPGNYLASESSNISGYSASVWGTDCSDDGSVTLDYGENKTCSITNDDIAPSLHLRKILITDDGGTAVVDDFTLYADGTGENDISGVSPVDSDSTLKADTFTLSETGPDHYNASDWDCIGGTQNGDQITLGLGEEATCTVTNCDVAPKLKLVKLVENKDIGTAVPDDWTLSATAESPYEARNFQYLGGSGDFATVFANAGYTLSETGPDGYTASDWSCNGGDLVNGVITLGLAEEVTCTITNTLDTGTITVDKVTDPSESQQEFTINLMQGLYESGTIIHSSVLADQTTPDTYMVKTGEYWFEELPVLGWILTDVVCTDGEESFDPRQDGFVLPKDVHLTCTFTNTLVQPEVSLTKTNDKPNINPGDIVTYTLTVTNDGNAPLNNLTVYDVPAGGFTYVSGTTMYNSVSVGDPSIGSDGKLTFQYAGVLGISESLTIVYQMESDTDLHSGIYTNNSVCTAYAFEEIYTECNLASSNVSIGQSVNPSASIQGQVLGYVLPATGSDTNILYAFIALLMMGISIKVLSYNAKRAKRYEK